MLTDQWLGLFVLMAIALGLQLAMSSKQAQAFSRAVRELRSAGQVSVGMGGGKWFGRRVFVALAADPSGTVVRAVRLRGISQFARPQEAHHYSGSTIRLLSGPGDIAGISKTERAAARQAAQLLDAAGGLPTASGALRGKERPST